MTNRKNIFSLAVILLVLCACGQNRKDDKFKALPFPDVSVPGMITEQQDVAEYIAMNLWNGITDPSRDYPCDSVLVSGVNYEKVEVKFGEWVTVLGMIPRENAGKAVAKLYDRAVACERKDTSSNVFDTFVSLTEKYLYDPNSPARDEDLYHVFVKRLVSYEGLDPVMKGKYEFDVQMTGLNRIGAVASDFRFSDRTGRMYTLHGIKAPVTLLFFSNPGCEACMEIINRLKGEPFVSEMISSGKLAVLNIYIDEDIQAWMDYMPVYPEDWYNGFDPDYVLRSDGLYSIRAIPSLYLLDSEKRVILKDATEDRLFQELTKIN